MNEEKLIELSGFNTKAPEDADWRIKHPSIKLPVNIKRIDILPTLLEISTRL